MKEITDLSGFEDISILEYEYTSLYVPLELEYTLDVLGIYLKEENKKILVVADDEILIGKILNRTFNEIQVVRQVEIPKSEFDIIVFASLGSQKIKLPDFMAPQGTLIIIAPNFINYDLSKATISSNLRSLFSNVRLLWKLRREGFSTEVTGFHTPKSIFYGRIHQLLNFLGQDYLADCIYFTLFKENFVTKSWTKYLSTLILIVGRRD